jgi:hypothetical protein
VSTDRVDIAVLQQERDIARRTIVRGVTMVLLIPIAIALGLAFGAMSDSFGPLLVASLYTIVGGAVGVASLGAGVVRLRIASKQLNQLEAERIPQARLLT